jgi:hypothetical protein
MVEVLSSPVTAPERTTKEQRPTVAAAPTVADPGPLRATARALDGRPSLSATEIPGHVIECVRRSLLKSPQLWWQLIAAVFVVVYCGSLLALPRPVHGYLWFWDGWIGNIAATLPIVPHPPAHPSRETVARRLGARWPSVSGCTRWPTSSTWSTTRT